MATIDTSKIEGYAAMTAEQKVAALESQQIPDAVDMTQYVSKATFDKKATEASDYSRQLKALRDANLSEEERLKQERAEFDKAKEEFACQVNGTMIRGKFGAGGLKPEEYAHLDIDHFKDKATAEQRLAAQNEIMAIYGELLSGSKTFEQIAGSPRNDDNYVRERSGRYEPLRAGSLPYEYEKNVFDLADGRYSQPFQTS